MPGCGPHDDRRDGGGRTWGPRFGTDDRDRRDGGGRAWGPRFGTDDGRAGRAPQQLGTRQVETRYDSLDFQHQLRSELTAHSSGARRAPSPRRHQEPSRRRGEPQRRCDEPPRRRDEPHRRYDDPSRKLRPPPPPRPPPRLPPPPLPPQPPPSRPPSRQPPPPLPRATPRTHSHYGQRDGEVAAAAEAVEAEAAGGLPELLLSPSLAGLYVIVGRGAPASGSGDRSLEEGELYDSRSLRQKRKHPDSAASTAPTQRAVGTPSSAQVLGRAPPAPKGADELARMLSGRISSAGSTHELLHLSSTHSASLNHIHAANLWNKLGKQGDAAGPRHREEMRRLLRRTVELTDSCEARNLSNIAHGLAKCTLLGLDDEAGALFAAVAEAAVRGGLRDFKPQGLANTAWAFATAGHAAPTLLDAVATEAVRRGLRDFKPQNLANIAWAFATAGRAAPTLLDAIVMEAVRRGLREFKPQELANTAWAFATAGHAAPTLLDAIATEAVRGGLRDFTPQALANIAWAFATAGRAAPMLLDAIATAAVPRLRDFTPQALANIAWAFATAGRAAPTLLDAIATEAVRRGLRDFNAQDLANTAWAFATAGRAAPALLDAIATEAVRHGLRDFKPQELANTAWAFATAGRAAPTLLDAIATEAVRRGLRDFNEQELANTAWAFAAADHLAPALFDSDAFVQQLRAAERSFAPDALRQLHQWQLWREERGAAWPPLPPELAQRCRAVFSSEDGVPSKLQGEVVASLQALGLVPREEVRTEQGYSLDAVALYGGRELAIEVDGPWHFCGRTPTGATALKRRQLRAAGWALLPVPYWEWNDLGGSSARQEYLRAALRHVLPAAERHSFIQRGVVEIPSVT